MREKTLLKTALICALAGIALLWFISQDMQLQETQINSLDAKDAGKDIRLKGIVNRVTNMEKIMLVEMMQPYTVTVLLFKENKETSLKPGDYIEASGRIEEYHNKPELIANLVKKI